MKISTVLLVAYKIFFLSLSAGLVNAWFRFNVGFPNDAKDMVPFTLNETLNMLAIYSEKFEIKTDYVGPHFSVVNNDLRFKCPSLMNEIIESNKRSKDPCNITPELQKKFTMNGLMSGGEGCAPAVQYGVEQTAVWTFDMIDVYNKKGQWSMTRCGVYGSSACEETCETYANEYIKNKVGMVLGSLTPWAEEGLVHYGAKQVITVEYMKIISQHPKVVGLHPVTAAEKYLNKTLTPVDFIFTYSSLEHDGLGRYGDPINPYADLESIARAYCLLKPNGVLFLSVPVGPDQVAGYNHRIYGKYRLSLILPLWEPIDLVGSYLNLSQTKVQVGNYLNQPIWVLKKKSKRHLRQVAANSVRR